MVPLSFSLSAQTTPCYGNSRTLDDATPPRSLMTCVISPPPNFSVTMWCILIPWTLDGTSSASTDVTLFLNTEYTPSPQASWIATPSDTLYDG